MNPWQELGLREDASAAEIKKAYRRLAAEHHPDRNPGDGAAAARFQRVRQAYEMIKDGAPSYGVPGVGFDPFGGSPRDPVDSSSEPDSGGFDPIGGDPRDPFDWSAAPHPGGFDPFGGVRPGGGRRVNFRVVAPEQLQVLIERLRRTLIVSVIVGLIGVIALGHGLRGLPWNELFWPHQLLFSFATGLVSAFVAFVAWLMTVRVLGFVLGTALFWAIILFGGLI